MLMVALLFVTIQGSSAADGPVSAMQDALRREHLLAGESTGALDEPTRAALRQFQVRRGLPATGEIDTATLQALESKVGKGPSDGRWQSREMVTASLKEAIAEQDRDFLRQVEARETPATAEPPVAREVAPPTEDTTRLPASDGNSAVVERAKARVEEKPRVVLETAPKPRRHTLRVESPSKDERAVRTNADEDADALGSHGTRIIRKTVTTTTTAGQPAPILEKRVATQADNNVIEVRRAEPVEARKKDNGFLHRLFRGEEASR